MIFPLSHRERGNKGERPVNQTIQIPLVNCYSVVDKYKKRCPYETPS